MTTAGWLGAPFGILLPLLLSACLGPPALTPGPSPTEAVDQPVPDRPPWCEWHSFVDAPDTCTGLKPEPWCVYVRYLTTSRQRDVQDYCTSTVAGSAEVFTIEDLAGQTVVVEAGPPDNGYANPRENGRPYFAVVWNRTGKALYHEWPTKVGQAQEFSFVLPPEPPYLVVVEDTAVSGEVRRVHLPGNWISTGAADNIYHQGGVNMTEGGKRDGAVHVAITSSTGSSTLTLPWEIVYANSGAGQGQGHTRANYTIYDPLGRLNMAYDNTRLTGSDIYVWGFPPIEGAWRFDLRLPQPAIYDTTWTTHFDYRALNLTAFKPLGFAWPQLAD